MVISQPPPTAGGMTVPPPSMMGSVQKPPPSHVPAMTSLGGHQHQLAVPSAQAVGTPIIGQFYETNLLSIKVPYMSFS
jgi:hypothetical protein